MPRLWLDASAGVAGDMFLGALLDLGAPLAGINSALARLGVKGLRATKRRVRRAAFTALQARVLGPAEPQPHRGLHDLLHRLDRSGLPAPVCGRAAAVFTRLARVEARLHGVPVGRVHFHEVGALDALGEVAGVCVGLHLLGVTEVAVSAVNVGSGSVRTAHGRLPVPAPATLELLRGFEICAAGPAAEHTTPTGAALLAEWARPRPAGEHWRALRVGYGAGERNWPDQANLLRAALAEGSATGAWDTDVVTVLTAHLDDASPQVLGYALERLFEAGALDVTLAPVQMKKNRPGMRLEVVARPGDAEDLTRVVFQETPTLGVRRSEQARWVLPRREARVRVPGGSVRVKIARPGPGLRTLTPEYEDARACARRTGRPLADILETARHKAREHR